MTETVTNWAEEASRDSPWPPLFRGTADLDEIWVPRLQLEDALRELVREALPSVAALGSALWLLQGLVIYFTGTDELRSSLFLSVVTGVALGAAAVIMSRLETPLAAANPIAMGIAFLIAGAGLVNLQISGEALFTVPFFLFVAASSMVFLEGHWFSSFVVSLVAAWLAVGFQVYGRLEWPYYGFSMVCVLGVSIWFFFSRVLTLRRLAHLQLQEAKRKELLLVQVDDAFKSSAELLELTVRDPLTGSYNRRYLGQLRAELESGGKSWGAILLDLNEFKRINDLYGHEKGDRALQKMAHFIRRQARAEDRLIRYGGDEFLLIMEVENEEEMTHIAHRFRRVAVEEAPVPFSMGAVFRHDGESLQALLLRADQEMYLDKSKKHDYARAGRTRSSA